MKSCWPRGTSPLTARRMLGTSSSCRSSPGHSPCRTDRAPIGETGSGLSVACRVLAGTSQQIAMRSFVMLLKEPSQRPQLVGNTQYTLGDSSAHSSPHYNSYEQDNHIGKFYGIPDTWNMLVTK